MDVHVNGQRSAVYMDLGVRSIKFYMFMYLTEPWNS